MPIYKYRCECGAQFEALKKMAAKDDPASCPICKKDAERVMAGPSVVIGEKAGKGFKVTDYPDIDKVIGADAEKRWGVLEARHHDRMRMIKEGATHIAHGKDGEQFPLSSDSAIRLGKRWNKWSAVASEGNLPTKPDTD